VGEKLLVIQEVKKKDIAVEFGIRPSTLSTIKKISRFTKKWFIKRLHQIKKKGKAVMYYLILLSITFR
jgi:hypothetical protein